MPRLIYSASNGKVLQIVDGVPGDGNKMGVIVIYDEENNISHRYVHCEANSTNGRITKNGPGSTVTKGQIIATMGNTGTDPVHLHYEAIVGKTTKYKPKNVEVLDPLTVFPQLLISMDLSTKNHGPSPGYDDLEKSYNAGALFSQRYQSFNYSGGGNRIDLLKTAFLICKKRGIAGNINKWTLKVLEDCGIDIQPYFSTPPPPPPPLDPSERLLVMIGDGGSASSVEAFDLNKWMVNDGDFKVGASDTDISEIWGNIEFFNSEDFGDEFPVATETSVIEYIKTTKIEKNIKETFLVGIGLGGQVVTKILRSYNGIDKVGLIDPIPYYKFTQNKDLSPANIPQKVNSIMYYGSNTNTPFAKSHWDIIENSGLFTTEKALEDSYDEDTDTIIPNGGSLNQVDYFAILKFFKKYGGEVGSNLILPPPPIYPFPNRTEGDKFRNWVNDKKTTAEIEDAYSGPEFASDRTLGKSGNYTGRYIEQAWAVWGAEYEATL